MYISASTVVKCPLLIEIETQSAQFSL